MVEILLSKEICMRCCGEYFDEEGWKHRVVTCIDLKYKIGHEPTNIGYVFNKPDRIDKKWLIYRGIPKWCPYATEHVLMLQKSTHWE